MSDTFKDCYQTLCDRTGLYNGVAYEGLPVDWKGLLDEQLRHALESFTWPDRVCLDKIAIAVDENGSNYIEIPSGEILGIYERNPVECDSSVDMGDVRVFNGKLYIPTSAPYVWIERNPPAQRFVGNEAAIVPPYVWAAVIEASLALIPELKYSDEVAAHKRNYAEKLLRENYIRLSPLRSKKIKVNTR